MGHWNLVNGNCSEMGAWPLFYFFAGHIILSCSSIIKRILIKWTRSKQSQLCVQPKRNSCRFSNFHLLIIFVPSVFFILKFFMRKLLIRQLFGILKLEIECTQFFISFNMRLFFLNLIIFLNIDRTEEITKLFVIVQFYRNYYSLKFDLRLYE